MNDLNPHFVYKGTEVVLTGRTASRKIQIQQTRRQRIEDDTVLETIYEIVPADPKNGSWTSWVKKEELFTISGQEDGTNENLS